MTPTMENRSSKTRKMHARMKLHRLWQHAQGLHGSAQKWGLIERGMELHPYSNAVTIHLQKSVLVVSIKCFMNEVWQCTLASITCSC